MGKRGLLISLGLLAAAACLWWMPAGARSQKPFPDAPARASDAQQEPTASLAEPVVPETELRGGSRSALEQEVPGLADADAAAEKSASAEATVVVQVLRSNTLDPVRMAIVLVLRADEGLPGSIMASKPTGGLGDAALTDARGRCTFSIPAGVRARAVLYGGSSTETGGREVVEPLAAGELREVTLVLQVFEHWLRVEDASDGAALAGARVEARGQVASSSPEGLAMLWCAKGEEERAEVEAEGYGSALFHVRRGHEDPETALVVRLSRTACLRGRLLDASGAAVAAANIEITANGRDLARTEPFGMLEDGRMSFGAFEDRSWSASTDASGLFAVCALPSSVPLRVSGVVDGEPVDLVERLRLLPGEQREVVYRLGALASIRGSVRDELGQPVPGCALWLWPGDVAFFPEGSSVPGFSLVSDAEGSFETAELSTGDWSVGPAPGSGYLPVPLAVHVGGADVAEVVITARVGRLFVAGIVLGPDGEPLPKAQVSSDVGPSSESGIDGGFALGPFAPGPVRLSVMAPETGALAPKSLQVQAGQQGIVLQFGRGGRLAGHLRDAATGEVKSGMVLIISDDNEWQMSSVGPSGAFAFEGLRPGIYGLAARAPVGAAGFLDRLDVPASGAENNDLVIQMVPGGQLSLRFPFESNYREYRVRSGACIFLRDTIGPAECMTPHLPPGAVTVELLTTRGAVAFSKEAMVRTGETVEVDLR